VEGDWSRWRAEGRFDSIRREYFTEIRDVLRLSRSKYEMEIQRNYNAIRKILEDIERLRKEQMDGENRILDDRKNQESRKNYSSTLKQPHCTKTLKAIRQYYAKYWYRSTQRMGIAKPDY